MKLYPYQINGRDFLSNNQKACLWDEPGLGKSFQSLSAAIKLNIKTAIIICPASVRMVWKNECTKLNLNGVIIKVNEDIKINQFNIFSYEGVTGKFNKKALQINSDLLLIDEAHYLKSHKSKRTKLILGNYCDGKNSLMIKNKITWALTGTPMPNNPSELWSVLHALLPDTIIKNNKPMNYWEFVNRYCITKNNGFGIQIIGGKNLSELKDRIKGRILRRKKNEVLKDLPPIRYHILPVEGDLNNITFEENNLIKECLEKDDPLEHLKKMKIHLASMRKITGMIKVASIIKWVKESEHKKIVIFAHHREVINQLKKLESSVYVDGSCSHNHRIKAVKEFQEGTARIFIGQIQSAGTGLTLTAASVLIFVEYSWVPAENRQAADRIHRIGQKDSCLIYFTMIPNSIDEDIIKVIKKKTETYKDMGL